MQVLPLHSSSFKLYIQIASQYRCHKIAIAKDSARLYILYSSDIGFSSSVDQQLMEAANVVSCPERDKYIIIILDEMHIREDLVYDKHTGIVHSNMHLNNINLQNRSYCWIC